MPRSRGTGTDMSSDANKNRLYGPKLLSSDSHSMVSRYLKECGSGNSEASDRLGPSVYRVSIFVSDIQ